MANKNIEAAIDRKDRIVIFIITLILSIVLIAEGIVMLSSNNSSNPHKISGTLPIGGTSISIKGDETVYYRIRPNTDSYYNVYSTNATSTLDPSAALYDSSWTELFSSDDIPGSRNFNISYELHAGEVYYVAIRLHGVSSVSIYTLDVCFERA